MHSALAIGGQLTRGAGDAGAAEVLDALDQPSTQHFQGAFDQEFLHERIAHLHARPLGGAFVVERFRGENRHTADAVAAGSRPVQHHQVADTLRARQMYVLMAHRTDAQRVHQRIAGVGVVENDLPTDVGQAQTVAITADTGDHTREHALGVGGIGRSETQGIHDRERPRAHRQDVAHDAAHAGRRTLVGLDVGRVVVALDLEGDGPTVADIDDAGVLPDTDEQRVGFRLLLPELPKVNLAGLVRAVLAPHHRIHRQLATGGSAPEDVADPLVLIGLQTKICEGLLDVRSRFRSLNGVDHRRAPDSRDVNTDAKKNKPSVLGPVRSSTACSGCGMRPTTLPRSLQMPAMSR